MAGDKNISGNLRLHLNGKKIFDATQCSLSLARETNRASSTKDTTTGAATKGEKSWSVGFEGLAVYAGDGNDGHQFSDLFDLWNDDSDALVHAEFVPSEGDYQFYYEGDVIVTQLDPTFSNDEVATITLSAEGASELFKRDKANLAPGA